MNLKIIMSSVFVFLMLVGVASANSQYGSIDVCYNDEMLPGEEVAKPTLKIGEPFKVRIEMTLNQTSIVKTQMLNIYFNDYHQLILF